MARAKAMELGLGLVWATAKGSEMAKVKVWVTGV